MPLCLALQDSKCLFDYNVQNRVEAFVQASRDISSVTYGDDILIPFGSDFQWVSAHQYYKNLDKLIHHVNEDGRINIFYSTPAEYVAVKHGYNHSWPLKTDDFFPYADCPVCYWTGQFVCPLPEYLCIINVFTAVNLWPSMISLLAPTRVSQVHSNAGVWGITGNLQFCKCSQASHDRDDFSLQG